MFSKNQMPEEFSRWVNEDFPVICKTFSRAPYSQLQDVFDKRTQPIWSHVVRHVMPRSSVLNIRNKLRVYHRLNQKGSSENADEHSSRTAHHYYSLVDKKQILEKLVSRMEEDLQCGGKVSDVKHSLPSIWEIALHNTRSKTLYLTDSMQSANLPLTRDHCYEKEFDVRNCVSDKSLSSRPYSLLDLKNVMCGISVLCAGTFLPGSEPQSGALNVWLKVEESINDFTARDVLQMFSEEICECKQEQMTRATVENSPVFKSQNNNSKSSLKQVQNLQASHIRKFFMNKLVLKKTKDLFDENAALFLRFQDDQYADDMEGKLSVMKAEKQCEVLRCCNLSMRKLMSTITLNNIDFQCLDTAVFQTQELFTNVEKVRNVVALLLAQNEIIIQNLSNKQRSIWSKASDCAQHEYNIVSSEVSKLLYNTPQKLSMPSIFRQTVKSNDLSNNFQVHSFQDVDTIFLRNALNFSNQLHALNGFVESTNQLLYKISTHKKVISMPLTIQVDKNFSSQHPNLSKLSKIIDKASEHLQQGEMHYASIAAALCDWWEQPAMNVIDFLVEGKTVKEWGKTLSVL